ncbi:MAG: LapA family protein [Deltaproteobacteria bacterium]|nr:LapA family protein [Deltaproteobacteria bacterium]
MRRLLFALLLALFFLVLVIFVLSNRDDTTFGYEMIFQFHVPHLFSRHTKPIPVGFVLMIAFCLGMVTTPFLEALPNLYKSLELRAKNKRIRQLERELTMVREMVVSEKHQYRSEVLSTSQPPETS